MPTKDFNFTPADPRPEDEIRPEEGPNLAAVLEACQLALNIMRLREPESIRARTITIVALLLIPLRGAGYIRFLYGWGLLQNLYPKDTYTEVEYLEAWRITEYMMKYSPQLVEAFAEEQANWQESLRSAGQAMRLDIFRIMSRLLSS